MLVSILCSVGLIFFLWLMVLLGMLKVLVSIMKFGLLFKMVLLWWLLKNSDCYWCIMFKCWLFSSIILMGIWWCLSVLSFCMFIMKELLLLIRIDWLLGCVIVVFIVAGKLKFMVLRFVDEMKFCGVCGWMCCVVYIWCWLILVEIIEEFGIMFDSCLSSSGVKMLLFGWL